MAGERVDHLPIRIDCPDDETTGPRVLSALRDRRPSEIDIDTLLCETRPC